MTKITFPLLAVAAGLCGCAALPSVELTRDGVPTATIVVARQPARAALWAAHDLQYHIGLITGAQLPIKADDTPVTGPRILVGESAATRQLGLAAEQMGKQEYLIRFLPDTLVLMGRDDLRVDLGLTPAVRVFGSPGWTDGKLGKALSFAGDAALTVTNFAFPDAEGTMEAWVRTPAEPSTGPGTILRLDGGGPWSYHIVQRRPNTRCIEYITYLDTPKASGSVASKELAEGWHHVMATYSAKTGQMELFVDNASQGKAPYVETTCHTSALSIGGMGRPNGAASNPFSGTIDEVRISNIVRAPGGPEASGPFTPDANTFLLVHCDEGQGVPAALAAGPPRPPDPPPMFEAQATCYAVYDFLERSCNVRWFNPTDFGTDYTPSPTLVVAGRDVRRAPRFSLRQVHPAGAGYDQGVGLWYGGTDGYTRYEKTAFVKLHEQWPAPGQYGAAKTKRLNAFLCRQRVGGEACTVNHSFYGYYDRFWEQNPDNPKVFVGQKPDWFSKDGGPGRRPSQLCYTCPELIQQVVQDARDFFDGKPVPMLPGFLAPGSNYFPLEPMDTGEFCTCERCKPEWHELQRYNGWSRGTHSDHVFTFANQVARGIRQTHPDKYAAILAYGNHAGYPEKVRVEPNVMVHFCFACHRLFYDQLEYESELRLLHEWATREKGRPLYLWLYYTFPMEIAWGSKGKWHAFPGYFVHTLDKQFKLFDKYGFLGMFHCGYGQEVEAYVTFKLMDDPTRNLESILDEYFTRMYGAAGAPLKQFYLLIEETYGNSANYPAEFFQATHAKLQPGHQTEEIAWKYLGTPERMARLAEFMARAKELARTDLEKARVAVFEKAVWDYLVEGRRKYEANSVENDHKRTLREALRHLAPTDQEKTAFEPNRKAMREAAPPTVRVPRIALPTAPDQVEPSALDWSTAARLARWYSVEGYPTRRDLEACAFHDGRALYLRLTEVIDTSRLLGEEDIFSGDDWEVFLAGKRGGAYCQYAVNPAGGVFANPTAGKLRDSVRAVSKVAPDRWQWYLTIPLDKLLPATELRPGMTFYANFYRAVGSTGELLAWSPNFRPSFHETSRLGEFVLGE